MLAQVSQLSEQAMAVSAERKSFLLAFRNIKFLSKIQCFSFEDTSSMYVLGYIDRRSYLIYTPNSNLKDPSLA